MWINSETYASQPVDPVHPVKSTKRMPVLGDMEIPPILADKADCLGVLEARSVVSPLDAVGIARALRAPVWPQGSGPTVFDCVGRDETVCIVVSDQTRTTATDRVLPILLAGLQEHGCCIENVSVLFSCGIHRAPTAVEIQRLLGDDAVALLGGRVFVHDAKDVSALVPVGTIQDGHTVQLNRRYVEADRRILLGAVTYHYHAGFGGGRKSIVPGLADYETIAYTHSQSLDPHADQLHPDVLPGRLAGNPVAQALAECADLCPPDSIVNTVLLPTGEIAGVVSGDMRAAHGEACELARRVYRVDIEKQADIVLASAGTAPNWIQSHKALFNAHRAVTSGGWVILQAPCPEGLGNERFRHWLTRSNLATLYRELRESPEVNGQTALSTRLRGKQAILVTSLADDDVAALGIRTAPTLTSAVEQVMTELAVDRPSYYVMPDARYPVPFVVES